MIINHKDKWIYLAMPKTGSRSMIRWIEQLWEVEKIDPPSCHSTTIPEECKDYFVFTTVRDPYQRAVSFWWSIVMRDGGKKYSLRRHCDKMYGNHDLETLLKAMISEPLIGGRRLGHHGAVSQTQFLDGIKPDLFLRQESYPNCLLRLPFTTPVQVDAFPHLNSSAQDKNRKVWTTYLTRRIVTLIDRWANEDFVVFGYPRLRPCHFSRAGGLSSAHRA